MSRVLIFSGMARALAAAARVMAMEESRDRGHSPEEVIAPAVDPMAKPTRYKPAPNNPPRGKRRRQWR